MIGLSLLLCLTAAAQSGQDAITPSDVYARVVVAERETDLILARLHVTAPPVAHVTGVEFRPRHVWQKAYMVAMRVAIFRRKRGFDAFSPVGVEPQIATSPRSSWEQAERLLTEIRIVKKLLGVEGEAGPAPRFEGKRPADVFSKLQDIEAKWDALNGGGFDPSNTFAQVLRFDEDVSALLRRLSIFDSAVPPAKNAAAVPADSLAAAFGVLLEVQRLQRLGGIDTIDFSALRKTEGVVPSDVFNLVCLALAELQQVKARAGIGRTITPPASHQENKVPADVTQLLGYVARRLQLIQKL